MPGFDYKKWLKMANFYREKDSKADSINDFSQLITGVQNHGIRESSTVLVEKEEVYRSLAGQLSHLDSGASHSIIEKCGMYLLEINFKMSES